MLLNAFSVEHQWTLMNSIFMNTNLHKVGFIRDTYFEERDINENILSWFIGQQTLNCLNNPQNS